MFNVWLILMLAKKIWMASELYDTESYSSLFDVVPMAGEECTDF
jgi:hypothetical protein